jgi:hypothetical protein
MIRSWLFVTVAVVAAPYLAVALYFLLNAR